MPKNKNIETFSKNYYNQIEKTPKEIEKLNLFTYESKVKRDIISTINTIIKKSNKDKEYIFNYNGKSYPFKVFSDYELQTFDKKTLQTPKRWKIKLLRTLKLACSMNLINPRVVIGSSIVGKLELLILYQEKGIDKVIDYSKNLVMNKDDYYEIFKYDEINIVTKSELYDIFYVLKKLENYDDIYEYLIFTKEIFKELSKQEKFKVLTQKYPRQEGYHKGIYSFLGNDADALYFIEEDRQRKYENLITELQLFTENPTKKTKHISYDKKKEVYKLEKRNFGYFTFGLLSDMFNDEDVKKELLSDQRYRQCHINSILVARAISPEDKETTYVVGGQTKINEIDSYYHSWVEIDRTNIVIDYNNNLVMNKDKYYKLFEAKPISKTHISEMEEFINTIINEAKLDLYAFDLNYFGKEIMRDLKKNKKILQRKNT